MKSTVGSLQSEHKWYLCQNGKEHVFEDDVYVAWAGELEREG